VLERHPEPIPDACEVCRYAQQNNLDSESEHALTRLATMMIIGTLQEDDSHSARMQRLATEAWDVGRGPVHLLAPRNWHWALFFEPALRVVLTEDPQ